MAVQPAFIIGTNNEDGSGNFAPITRVSVTHEAGDGYLPVISMFGNKTTGRNVLRTGVIGANLVNREMLPLMDYFGTHKAENGAKTGMEYAVSRGEAPDVPVPDVSPWVYECRVKRTVETGDSTTFFCEIVNVQIDETVHCADTFDIDLTKPDPVIYSGKYHSIGKLPGSIGEFGEK